MNWHPKTSMHLYEVFGLGFQSKEPFTTAFWRAFSHFCPHVRAQIWTSRSPHGCLVSIARPCIVPEGGVRLYQAAIILAIPAE